MAVKPTSYSKFKDTTVPEYEVITPEEAAESADCCICDNENTWCNPESPNGMASLTTSAGAQVLAFWVGR